MNKKVSEILIFLIIISLLSIIAAELLFIPKIKQKIDNKPSSGQELPLIKDTGYVLPNKIIDNANPTTVVESIDSLNKVSKDFKNDELATKYTDEFFEDKFLFINYYQLDNSLVVDYLGYLPQDEAITVVYKNRQANENETVSEAYLMVVEVPKTVKMANFELIQ